ncbi:MAG TPA: NUDIX domain-containing protein [Solirubrobacteraceae bacterium]|nr:NUDIX domain-containing protein [Solirubrobacteraceae bacterium]
MTPSGSGSRRAGDRRSEPFGEPKPTAAAVCFRRRDGQVQVRLVRTRDGERWTFPNGPSRADETLPQAAAREAAERAGVTGVVSERPLTEYRLGRRSDDLAAAFLIAVQSIAPSVERGHDPTWCDLATARAKLAEGREPGPQHELQRVIELAEHELEDR